MKKISLKVLTLVAVLTTAGLVTAEIAADQTTLDQIAGYRNWTRVNPEPVKVDAPTVVVASSRIGFETPV